MCDKANYKTVSSSATVREPEFFIKACLNKLAKLVFGHDNNYLESMRLRVWGCIFFSTLDRTERRSSDNTSRNAEDASVWWTPGKVMSVKTAWIHTCTVQQVTVVWVSWVRFTTSSMRGENPAPTGKCMCVSVYAWRQQRSHGIPAKIPHRPDSKGDSKHTTRVWSRTLKLRQSGEM